MSNEHFLAELLPVAGRDNIRRNSGQVAVLRTVGVAQNKRNQPGPRLLNLQSELPREIVAERSSTNLRNRETAGGNHQDGRVELILCRPHDKLVAASDVMNLYVQKDGHVRGAAFFFQHR